MQAYHRRGRRHLRCYRVQRRDLMDDHRMRDHLFELVRIRQLLDPRHLGDRDRDPDRGHRQDGLQLVLDDRAWSLGLGVGHRDGDRRRNHQRRDRLDGGLRHAFPGWSRTGCYPDGDQPDADRLGEVPLGANRPDVALRHLPQCRDQCDPCPGLEQMGCYLGEARPDAVHRDAEQLGRGVAPQPEVLLQPPA